MTSMMQQPPQLDVRLETEGNDTHPFINPSASTLSPDNPSNDQDNTVTFLIGFGILVLFVVAGIMASVFLCVTLKKDPYLWEAVFDGGPVPPEEQQPQQQEAEGTVLDETASPTASTSNSNKKYSNEDGGCFSTISVDSYTIECHRNADAIL
ncbi:hypothetical protein C0J52_19609 [Blattella germanica]|nr:hypothetical protein C0J52_19609 [Blattella germanica]